MTMTVILMGLKMKKLQLQGFYYQVPSQLLLQGKNCHFMHVKSSFNPGLKVRTICFLISFFRCLVTICFIVAPINNMS